MPLYEHVFLARQDLSQAQVDALAATATEIVESNNGKVTKTETWGLRSLAYKIQKNRKAHFVMLNIDAPPAWWPSWSARRRSTKTSSAT
jgi:small subunit ribosomal protein S6